MVIFDEYIHGGHKLNPSLLWEYDLEEFDWLAIPLFFLFIDLFQL